MQQFVIWQRHHIVKIHREFYYYKDTDIANLLTNKGLLFEGTLGKMRDNIMNIKISVANYNFETK